jgi:hypothetical protein
MSATTILLSLISALLAGLVVAIANHWMTRTRELEKKTTDVRVEYLIECCLKFEKASCLGSNPSLETIEESYEDIESAFSKIMLLGDPNEIAAVKKFAQEFASSKNASAESVVNSLRDSLRKKLGLEPAGKWDLFLRVKLDK